MPMRLAAVALLLLAGCASLGPGSPLRAGAARVEITPEGPIRLSGYASRTTPSEGVEHPLFVRAVAFEDQDGRRALVIAADAIAVNAAITGEIAKRVAALTGVPRERFALAASHSHTAPAMTEVIPNILALGDPERAVIDAYTKMFIDRTVQACEAAVADLGPARLSTGLTAAGFGANRRTPGGPVDQQVPVLRIERPEGTPRAFLYGYACHCTTLQLNRVSGDWAGFASADLEAAHPGTVAACLIGCGADTNPTPRSTVELARRYGRELADAVGALRDCRPVTGLLAGRFATVDLPFDVLPTSEELKAKLEKGRPEEKRLAARLLEKLPAAVTYPVQCLAIGEDLAFVFLGGEVVIDHQLRLRRDYERVWAVAYANDVPGYIPSERILAEGGYEGGGSMIWYGQPTKFAKGVEELIHRKVRDLVPAEYRRPALSSAKSPTTPEESLRLLQVEPGFAVDLVASEPLLRDPIHVSWDARGRMYATEMIDYPEGPPAGRIMRLEDADGDGRMDRGTVFAEGLAFPTSAMPWRKGVLVTCDPDLFYLEDTDGDGRADVRKVLFTGFAGGNTQHRVNNLQWGLDNWVYGGNGDSSATIRSVSHPERPPVVMTFADFRFRPDTGEFEVLAEHSGYAMTFDDAGNRFVSGSGGNMRHVVFDRRLRDRSPLVPGVTNAQAVETRQRLRSISGDVERFNDPLDAGYFTSASGLHVYRGGIFPPHYRGNLFMGESMGNLVHRDVLVRQGASFKAAPHSQPAEFLASRDPWFRPVFTTTGPDGCLTVVDMYRAVIEHPEWIPNDVEKTLDLAAGSDRGRVYRVRALSAPPLRTEDLEALSGVELVARLESPNGWVRDTVQRLLVERQDRSVAPALAAFASRAASPVTRLQAMWTLQGLGALDATGVRARLQDPDPRVRESAVRLALPEEAATLKADPDPAVRLRVAARLGESDTKEAVEALGDLLLDPAVDERVKLAACLVRPDAAHRVLARVLGGGLPYVWRLSTVVGVRGDATQIRQTLDFLLAKSPLGEGAMVALGGGIVEGLGRRGRRPGTRLRELADPVRLAQAVEDAARMAEDPKVVDGTRYDALLLLGADPPAKHAALVRKYLSPRHSPELQSGAILGTSYQDGADVAAELLRHWAAYAPAQREAVLDAIFARGERIPALLEAVERKAVSPQELGAGRKEQLRRLQDAALRERAAKLLDSDTRDDRRRVVELRQKSLELAGSRARGIALFQKHCAECHPVQGVGPNVGPDLVTVRKRERTVLLMDLLDPNASVSPNYVAYNVATRDEVIHSGLVVSQSPAAVTLRLKGGVERAIPRAEIEELKSTGKSLMPEMFETVMSDQELADLIEYLRQIQ
jgi:putative membrane-bound dehydrogenase-like protein